MLSLNIHIKNQSSPEQPGISGSDSLFLSIVALSRELLFAKLSHTGCEIKVLTNVISERPEGFYNLPTAYATVHKLFLVRVKQNKTKHVSFAMVKRLHRIFGNGSWLLFPMITRVHISLMIPGRAGDEMCLSLSPPFLPPHLSISKLLWWECWEWDKGRDSFSTKDAENWRVAHRRLQGNSLHITYTTNSKQIMHLNS